MGIKYGYVAGTEQFFFQLSLIDVFDRTVIDYHLGLSCAAQDAARLLKNSLRARGLAKGMTMPKLRTDNGPQFIAKTFEETCAALRVVHERTPVKTPNLNSHIEAFHAILEWECHSRHEFGSFVEAYREITRYVEYYDITTAAWAIWLRRSITEHSWVTRRALDLLWLSVQNWGPERVFGRSGKAGACVSCCCAVLRKCARPGVLIVRSTT